MTGLFPSTKPGISIRIFLADGTPEGLRIVEKSHWTGIAVVTARSQYTDVRTRDEFSRPGVYVLVGPSDEGGVLPRVYIGEAEDPRKRIDHHLADKDFWTRLILFSSKDGTLNKAHVKYLESKLVQRAHLVKRAEVENTTAPQAPALSEAETADADGFLEDMLLLFPVLEITAFDLPNDSQSATSSRLHLSGPLAQAEGKETPDGFIVYAGALARKEVKSSMHGYMADLRTKLLDQGILVDEGEQLRFSQDYAFNSPSTAAGVVLGRAANGRTEWRDESGKTLKQLAELAARG